jgi:glycine dehydrogenase subunit 1
MATAATIHMTLLGPDGLERVAAACHANTVTLAENLGKINGVKRAFTQPVFHEIVLRLPIPVGDVLRALEAQGIVGGFDLTPYYPELGQAILVCATETRTAADLQKYAEQLERIVSRRSSGPTCTKLVPTATSKW